MKKKPGRIRAALFSLLGAPFDLRDDAVWSAIANNKVAGAKVDAFSVMQLSAAWACVRLISETVATLPLQLYQKTSEGRVVLDDNVASLVRAQPNATTTATTYWGSNMAAVLLRGNGLSEMKYIGERLVALEFLDPCRLRVTRYTNGRKQYFYKAEDGSQREISESKIFRIPGFSLDGDWGVSAITYGAQVFGSALGAQQAANKTFENGLLQTIAYSVPGKVDPRQRQDFKELMKEKTGSANSGEPILLEQGMTASPLGIKPSDAQLLETRNFGVEEVCRWFGVPPSMVGHTGGVSNWGTGIEAQSLGFLQFTMRPWLARVEEAATLRLLTPAQRARGWYFEFNIEGLLRADSAGRSALFANYANNGVMTRDEIRSKENLPAKGGNAGILTVQSAMVPLDTIGKNTNEA